jgi:hypothetical protein
MIVSIFSYQQKLPIVSATISLTAILGASRHRFSSISYKQEKRPQLVRFHYRAQQAQVLSSENKTDAAFNLPVDNIND